MVVSSAMLGASLAAVGVVLGLVVWRRKTTRSGPPEKAAAEEEHHPSLQEAFAASVTNIMSEPIRLGPYELVSQLGQGNMAQVYKARDTRDGKFIALKVVRQEHLHNQDFKRRFEREVELSQHLRHPNIVGVYEAIRLEDQLCMTMEFVDGRMLEDILKRGPLPLQLFPKLAVQMLDGLHFAHKRHMFHRDMKPANIMLTRKGEVKILDFGLAIEEGQTRFTHVGFSMGTPTHMAPEMLTKGVSNAHTDQYALGVVFYEMLTGKLPFTARNPMELGMMHVQEEPPPIAPLRPDAPITWIQITGKMMAKKPADRYNDLAQIQTLLSQSS